MKQRIRSTLGIPTNLLASIVWDTLSWGCRIQICWMLSCGIALAAQGDFKPDEKVSISPTNTLPLTNVADVLALSPDRAQANRPVHLHGLVTHYTPDIALFVQDETAGVYVYMTGDRPGLKAGDYVEVKGAAGRGRFSNIIGSPQIQKVETGPAIRPKPVSIAEIYLGGLDAQWVTVSGVVRSQQVNNSWLQMELAVSPHRITILFPNHHEKTTRDLTGCIAEVTGVVGSLVAEQGKLAGFQLFANSLSDVKVIQAADGDPFSKPVTLIRDLNSAHVRRNYASCVRVQGVVTLWQNEKDLFVQDTTGGLSVHCKTACQSIPPGTELDIVGFLGPISEPLRLEEAVFRKAGFLSSPQPTRVQVDDLFQGLYEGRLVEVDAYFLDRTVARTNVQMLALQSGSRFLTALVNTQINQGALSALQPRCHVRVRGVCQAQEKPGHEASVSLLMRGPEDLEITALAMTMPKADTRMPWAAALVVAAGLAAALLVVWNQRLKMSRVLQRQVSLQAEMRASEEQLRRAMEERDRIGRDLHDDIIQSIYAVGLNLEDCRRVVQHSPQKAEARVATAINALNNTIRSVRGFISGLEPKVLNGREFKTALKSLALTSGEGQAQFQIEVHPTAANALTSVQATQLLHIAKEALSNCLRHAQASCVTVSLVPTSSGIKLEVQDNGIGFTPEGIPGTGHGLRNMTSRARDIGAELKIISAPGEGCSIVVNVTQPKPSELS